MANNQNLLACPTSPNCVLSSIEASERAYVKPIPLGLEPSFAWKTMQLVVEALPRTRILQKENFYLRAECVSRVFRFKDDLEILINEEKGVFEIRSASRTGYSDMGVNRKRVEKIRAEYGRRIEILRK